jgi:hypothetical protein
VTGEELQRLKRLIRAAGDSARRLGDEPEEEPEGVGYFSPTSTNGLVEAIDSIAGYEEQITMFVGAGVSAEAELPAWERLVRTLLAETDIAAELTDEDRRLWIEATIAQGPLAAAAIAELNTRTSWRFAVLFAPLSTVIGRHPATCQGPSAARSPS